MENTALIKRIEEPIQKFLNQLTESFQNDHDIIMFYEILNGTRFQEGNALFKLGIGSARRLNKKIFDEPIPSLFYNEFTVQIRLTAKSFHMMATLFSNEENKTEGFSYTINETINSGMADETWVLFNQDHKDSALEINGRNPELLFEDIYKLMQLNREIRISSELEPTEETMKIHKQFNELMLSAADDEIDWALSNELETEEKIRVLQNLSTDRKLSIIQNLTNENIN
jgi:hypothetical protein